MLMSGLFLNLCLIDTVSGTIYVPLQELKQCRSYSQSKCINSL